jgi:hypothetical protein
VREKATCRFWFIAERNTVTDEIVRTYPAGEPNERVEFAAKLKAGEGRDDRMNRRCRRPPAACSIAADDRVPVRGPYP